MPNRALAVNRRLFRVQRHEPGVRSVAAKRCASMYPTPRHDDEDCPRPTRPSRKDGPLPCPRQAVGPACHHPLANGQSRWRYRPKSCRLRLASRHVFQHGFSPPKRASRLALSRCINARSASRTNAVFSEAPAKASALASRSSSSAMRVRLAIFFNESINSGIQQCLLKCLRGINSLAKQAPTHLALRAAAH